MTKEDLESAHAALPEGVSWGDPLTPEIVRGIMAAGAPAAEPIAYQYLYSDPFGNGDVWRNDGYEWNGQRPKGSRGLYTKPQAVVTP